MTATLVFLSLPPKTFVGFDLVSFSSSPKFLGITKIPPGIHFLYTGTDASLSIRQGKWLNLNSNNLHQIFRWSSNTETLETVDQDEVTDRHVISSIANGRGLVDYAALQRATSELATKDSENEDISLEQSTLASPEEDRGESTDWPSLASHISSSLLTRVLSAEWVVSSISSAPDDTETIPGLSHLEASNALHQLPLNLIPVNLKQTWADEDIGRMRTDRARDRSWYLSHLIQSITSPEKDKALGAEGLLGELQFCFLTVLTLANYSCLEQWKRLLTVFFTCRTALDEVEAYFVEVVKVLYLQVRHVEDVEGGLFELRDEQARLLVTGTLGTVSSYR